MKHTTKKKPTAPRNCTEALDDLVDLLESDPLYLQALDEILKACRNAEEKSTGLSEHASSREANSEVKGTSGTADRTSRKSKEPEPLKNPFADPKYPLVPPENPLADPEYPLTPPQYPFTPPEESRDGATREKAQLEALVHALERRYGLSWNVEQDRQGLLEALAGDAPYCSPTQRRQNLQRQIQLIQAREPGFRLEVQLHDPLFCRLTRQGVPLFAAYTMCCHQKDLADAMDYGAYHAALGLWERLRKGTLRPKENGMHCPTSPHWEPDPRSLSSHDRQHLRQRVARGEKIYW